VIDNYQHLSDEAPLPPAADVFVSRSRWNAERETLLSHRGRVAVRVPGDADPDSLHRDGLSAIAIDFPTFTDGRGFSLGRLLRERWGPDFELRAGGAFLRDQIFYLSRVGFDAFELPEGEDLDAALRALDTFGFAYQPAPGAAGPDRRA